MKFTVKRDTLKNGLSVVGRAAATSKSAMPVLQHVLLAANEKHVTLAATNLDVSITQVLPAAGEQPGTVTLPVKLLAELVDHIHVDEISFALTPDNQEVSIVAPRYAGVLKGIDADDFPAISRDTGNPICTFDAAALRTALRRTIVAASTSDARPTLQSVLLQLDAVRGRAALVATDSYRLALSYVPADDATTAGSWCIFAANLRILSDILPDSGAVCVYANNGHLSFVLDSITVGMRLVAAQFPAYERVIPDTYTTRIVVKVDALRDAMMLARPFARQSSDVVKCTVSAGDGRVELAANAAEVGRTTTEVAATVTGVDVQFAANVRFLLDALAVLGTDTCAIESRGSQFPLAIRPVGDDAYLHIVMPVIVQ